MRKNIRSITFTALFVGSVSTMSDAANAADPHLTSNAPVLECNNSIVAHFKPNANTKVLMVKVFNKGELFPNEPIQHVFDPTPQAALAELCLVKLLVGPGNPGPPGAPSTSIGIGIEVWLPAKTAWNGRVHALGGGGWAGSEETDPTKISSGTAASDVRSAPAVAAREGAVASTTDTGHSGGFPVGGAFAMKPDGTVNTTLWNDFSSRAIHEQVVQAKALATAYYGSAAKFSYWDGASTGGRQGLKQAQRYPEDFDGILVTVPAINWTEFATYELYPQVVIQRDLAGKHLTTEQLNLVSNAAIAACDIVDGKHLGFIIDPSRCHYDPTKDSGALCTASGGKNGTSACVTQEQALALNKIWYGITTDGSVPDPALDNGFGPLTGKHKWYGLPRGTSLLFIASDLPMSIGSDLVALELQTPKIATPAFHNASGNGTDQWMALSYEKLSKAFDAGLAMQSQFGFINTDDPDLSAFKAHGGKLLHFHGTGDGLIPYQGSINYYERVLAKMGGPSVVQQFYRFYLIPGMAHGVANGTANSDANPPVPGLFSGEFYDRLTEWVEKGTVPEAIVLKSASASPVEKSMPICVYPSKSTYLTGDIYAASSYTCR